MDGTLQFTQIYIIHAHIDSNRKQNTVVSVAVALFKIKCSSTYMRHRLQVEVVPLYKDCLMIRKCIGATSNSTLSTFSKKCRNWDWYYQSNKAVTMHLRMRCFGFFNIGRCRWFSIQHSLSKALLWLLSGAMVKQSYHYGWHVEQSHTNSTYTQLWREVEQLLEERS